MKTRFKVTINDQATNNNGIYNMIANHNSGRTNLTFSIIEGYLNGIKAQYPTIDGKTVIEMDNEYTMRIIESGKTTLVITQEEIHELETTVDTLIESSLQ